MSRKLVDGKVPIPHPDADKGGRKSILELDDALEERILNALKIGSSVGTAAAFNGLSYEVIRNWVLKGKEFPESRYGAFIQNVQKAIAEWELRDIAVIDRHANGRPAEFLMEPARDNKGNVVWEVLPTHKTAGKPIMVVARDDEGRPIIKSQEIKSDWRAAMERMSRRMPRYWARTDKNDIDGVLTLDNKKADSKEAMTFDERVAQAMKKLEEDV